MSAPQLFGFGGTPSEVITDQAGNVLPDWPVQVLVPATGQIVTDLVEDDGTTPIASPIHTNPANSLIPGRIRPFKTSIPQVAYRTYDSAQNLLPEWRQLSPDAYVPAPNALPTSGGKVTGDLEIDGVLNNPGGRTWHVAGLGPSGGDTASTIQAAVDAAYTAGGGLIVLSGFHAFVGAVILKEGVTVDARRATIQAQTTHHMFVNYGASSNTPGYTNHGNITWIGGILDGNAYDPGSGVGVSTGANLMTFSHGHNIRIIGTTFQNVANAHGLEFNACDNCLADRCLFEGYIDSTPGGTRAKAEAIQIDSAVDPYGDSNPKDDTPAINVTIRDCISRPSDRLGSPGALVGSHTNVLGSFDNITVTGCRVFGAELAGIHLHGWSNARLTNNYVEDAPAGILCELSARQTDASNVIITGNTLSRCGGDYASIHMAAMTGQALVYKNVVITDNIIEQSAAQGILVHQAKNVTVRGNIVNGCTQVGVTVGSGVTNLLVDGNHLIDCAAVNGIYLDSTVSGAVIQNNLLSAAGTTNGIVAVGANGTRIRNNTVIKGSSTMTIGINISSGTTGCVVIGNDLSGNGWTASAFNLNGAVTGFAGSTAVPGSNLVS